MTLQQLMKHQITDFDTEENVLEALQLIRKLVRREHKRFIDNLSGCIKSLFGRSQIGRAHV